MEITLRLPDVLATKLQTEARSQRRSTEDVAVELLDQALENGADAELDTLVASIRALPPNPANQFDWEAAREGLAEYLAASIAAEDPNEEFDQEEWQRNWDAVEAEMKAVTRANNLAEGRL